MTLCYEECFDQSSILQPNMHGFVTLLFVLVICSAYKSFLTNLAYTMASFTATTSSSTPGPLSIDTATFCTPTAGLSKRVHNESASNDITDSQKNLFFTLKKRRRTDMFSTNNSSSSKYLEIEFDDSVQPPASKKCEV